MSYQKVNWLNKGETGAKYINKTNLNQMDNGIYNLDLNKVEVIQLLTVGDTAPVECERGDKYYNTTDELIYTATTTDTWGTEGETPLSTRLYVDLSSSKLYYYDGTNFDSYGGGGGGETLPVGIILPFSDDTIPEGYMLCDGTAISRTIYAKLFNVIGTTYGAGDGSTTFNLPNLKGKVPVGYDSTDSDFDTLGETGGEKTHVLADNELPNTTNKYLSNASSGLDWGIQSGTSYAFKGVSLGSGEAHNNLQPYQVVNYIIKVLNAQNGEVRSESLPVGTELDFDGASQDIPTGWEEIDNSTTIIYKRTEANANLDNLTNTGIYGVFNATGTLPSGYSSNDNNFFIEVLFWYVDYGRQIAHDVRTSRTFIRNMNNGNWQSWKEFQIN